MPVPVVNVEHVTKEFTLRKVKSLKESAFALVKGQGSKERFTALEDVSLTINAGDSLGLVGPNGSGKSTLLKLIGGILAPNAGRILVRGRIAALLELGAGFHPDLTGRENVYLNAAILGLTRAETDLHFDEIVDFSGISEKIDTQVKFYSSGQYVRLAFAVAVHVDPDILLVDEVLAVGDEPFQVKCMEKIREFQREGRTIVLVSHSAAQVAEVCDRAIVLEKGKVIEDASPRVALSRLRADYGAAIEAARQRNDTQPSAFKAHILGIDINPDGLYRPRGLADIVLPKDADLVVAGEIDFETVTDNWELTCIVEGSMGGLVFGTDTRIMRETMPTAHGVIPFRLTFSDVRLGQGDYIINVAVRDHDGVTLDSLSRGAMFTVTGDGRSVGGVAVNPRVEVLSREGPHVTPATTGGHQ